MTFISYQDRQRLLDALETVAALVRQPAPTLPCGDSDPDPAVERRIVAAREQTGHPVDPPACGGQTLVVTNAYRCVECGRWFHHDCILAHFNAHRTGQTP